MRIAAIFAVFVIILAVSNFGFLVRFFSLREKRELKKQLLVTSVLDTGDTAAVASTLSEISEKYNFDVEIYDGNGVILFTTHGSQMMDYFAFGNQSFSMLHEKLKVIKSETMSDGTVFETAVKRSDGREYLLCRGQTKDGLYAEVRIQKEFISSSAAIANQFIIIVSSVCLVLSLIWVLVFARKFSKPIYDMSEITRDMAQLKFDRKVEVKSRDEIGRLAVSINDMSESLSAALGELKESNARLRDEIELERQLDVMRKGFVANVSHELKTPISIISGYAEGLKLNINSQSKEEYCNIIIDESARMNRLVLSILELSRYESGQMPLNIESFDVGILANDMLSRLFKQSDVKTENLIPENTFISADPVQTEQVLKAYLENAASHTPSGGTVTVTSEIRDGTVRVSVINTGSHVDEDIMPQIWQSFYRGDKSHKRENSRFGLGLSIVSAIMKLHSHDCGVYNTENGVCFWFEADSATGLEGKKA